MSFSSILLLIKQGDFSEAKKKINNYIANNDIKKEDISLVSNYFTSSYSSFAGSILYKMLCADKQYYEAYETYMRILSKCMRKKDISLEDAVCDADEESINRIYDDFLSKLTDDIDIPQSLLVTEVVDVLIPTIWKRQNDDKYGMITAIANNMWFEELKTSNYLYEIAVSCAKSKDELAEKLFLKLIEKEPANSAALNDMGMLFENKLDFERAKLYYGRAYKFCVNNQEYRKNLERVSGTVI